MAMMTCPECGREVSDRAAVCPNCGNPIGNTANPVSVKKKSNVGMILKIIFGVLALVLTVLAVRTSSPMRIIFIILILVDLLAFGISGMFGDR